MDAGTHIARLAALGAALCLFTVSGCERKAEGPAAPERPASCPETRRVEPPMPNVAAEHETAAYWIGRSASYGQLDQPLLDAAAVARHNLALRQALDGEAVGQVDLLAPLDDAAISTQVSERLAYLRERIEDGTLVDARGRDLSENAQQAFASPAALSLTSEYRWVESQAPLRCGPLDDGLYHLPIDTDFDRNRCSTIREGELVQMLSTWPNDEAKKLPVLPNPMG